MDTSHYRSPVGILEIRASAKGVTAIHFGKTAKGSRSANPHLRTLSHQLDRYFEGKLKKFSVPFVLEGSDFQKKVWRALSRIPYGKTVSYRQLASRIGAGRAYRALGNANGKNALPILLPCHRVIREGGALGGYSAGVSRKKWLLRHEEVSR